MGILDYNEIRVRKYIVFEGDPYEVLDSHVFRKQQRKPVNATKLKNLLTGKVVEHSFHVSDTAQEAEIDKEEAVYLYNRPNRQSGGLEIWFAKKSNPSDRFMIPENLTGNLLKFIKPNTTIDVEKFGDKMLGIKLPVKVELKVTEAPPAIKGNTAQGGTKVITLETGSQINAPLFVNAGETIVVNTDTGEYVERKS